MEEIIITIEKNGATKLEVKGVKGQSCKALTKDFEQRLGKKVSDVPTGEMYEQERTYIRGRS